MEGFLGEIRMFSGSFPPRNWEYCEGQILKIEDKKNSGLFSILGTTYGGDGRTSFALPDLRTRIPYSEGGAGHSIYKLGEKGGEQLVEMTPANLPRHSHVLNVVKNKIKIPVDLNEGTQKSPNGALLAKTTAAFYTQTPASLYYGEVKIDLEITLDTAGEQQPIDITQPSLGMNYIICVNGVPPSRG